MPQFAPEPLQPRAEGGARTLACASNRPRKLQRSRSPGAQFAAAPPAAVEAARTHRQPDAGAHVQPHPVDGCGLGVADVRPMLEQGPARRPRLGGGGERGGGGGEGSPLRGEGGTERVSRVGREGIGRYPGP